LQLQPLLHSIFWTYYETYLLLNTIKFVWKYIKFF
jgi:hypothetical protein